MAAVVVVSTCGWRAVAYAPRNWRKRLAGQSTSPGRERVSCRHVGEPRAVPGPGGAPVLAEDVHDAVPREALKQPADWCPREPGECESATARGSGRQAGGVRPRAAPWPRPAGRWATRHADREEGFLGHKVRQRTVDDRLVRLHGVHQHLDRQGTRAGVRRLPVRAAPPGAGGAPNRVQTVAPAPPRAATAAAPGAPAWRCRCRSSGWAVGPAPAGGQRTRRPRGGPARRCCPAAPGRARRRAGPARAPEWGPAISRRRHLFPFRRRASRRGHTCA